jgi:hypothetical protein
MVVERRGGASHHAPQVPVILESCYWVLRSTVSLGRVFTAVYGLKHKAVRASAKKA